MEKKLGVEIEFTGVARKDVVTALENLFCTKAEEVQSKTAVDRYKYHRITDSNGDNWLVVRDRSITSQAYEYKFNDSIECDRFAVRDLKGTDIETDYMVELVSPALTSKSLPLLFSVIDLIKGLGGITNSSCGIHVHIDRPDSFEDIITLFKRFCLEQDNIFNYFKVEDWRLKKYCKPYNSYINIPDFDNLDDFMLWLWNNYRDLEQDKHTAIELSKSLRYYGLNFYSLYQHNTIEFRLFNSSLDRTEVARILDWVLHFVYTVDEYSHYIPILGGILMNEVKE